MLPIQILLIAFFVIVMIKVITRYYRGELPLLTTISWVIFWVLASAIVAQPDMSSSAAKLFGIGRGADVIVYFALVALFFLVFRLMVKIEKLEREITKVVREKSLK